MVRYRHAGGKITIRNNLVNTSKEIQLTTLKTETSHCSLELSEGIVNMLIRHKIAQEEYKMKLWGDYEDNDLICCYPDGRMIAPKNFSKKIAYFL